MFDFLRGSTLHRPSDAVRRAIQANGLPAGTSLDSLSVVQSPATYAGRDVTNFRMFDARRAAGRSVEVLSDHAYQDLNAHLDLVLHSGFLEPDGTVVVFARTPKGV